MLDALLSILRTTSLALGTWLGVHVKLSDNSYILIFDIVSFLFLVSIFINLAHIIMSKSFYGKSRGKH